MAIDGLIRGVRSLDFWLLALSFGVCGFSTNGLIGTHLIAFCVDHGYTQFAGAGILASLGVFSLIGSTISGWLTDRYNPRILLFWIFGLRGLSLMVLPYTNFDSVSLTVFAVFYGLDWIAVMPPIFALVNEVFGKQERAGDHVVDLRDASDRRRHGGGRRRRRAHLDRQLPACVHGERAGVPARVDSCAAYRPRAAGDGRCRVGFERR